MKVFITLIILGLGCFCSLLMIGNIRQRIRCKQLSNNRHRVILEDKYAEYMLDSDELNDPPILIEITYNDLGKIVSICPVHTYCGYKDINRQVSSKRIQQKFFDTCNINSNGGLEEFKKYTYYKEKA